VSSRVSLAVVLGFLALPAIGRAQYGGYPAAPPPVSPYGQGGYNPVMSPEMQQLMMQRMAAEEQAAFQQQVQVYQAWAKANPKEAAALEKAYRAQMDPNAGNVARRKKKAVAKPAAKAPAANGAKPAAKSEKPAADAEAEESPTAATKAATTAAAPTAAATSNLRSTRQTTAKAAGPK
jgi:hypothetical protein